MSMLVVCGFIAFLYPVTCTTRYRIYNKTDVSTECGVISEMEAASELDCASTCLESRSCKSSQFNKTTNKCRMSTASLAAPDDSGTVYSTIVVTCTTRYRIYNKTDVSTECGVISEMEAASELDCASTCLESRSCKWSQYNKTTNKCRMSTASLAAPDDRGTVYSTVVDNCPAEQGYSIWTYADMQLCLKYYSSGMIHADATCTCSRDGAHLVLIESPAVRMRINETLSGLGVTDLVWWDGYDATGSTNQFLNWKGEPLTWIEWGGLDPDDKGGDDCMVGKYRDGYKYRDSKCHLPRTVLCQMDIM